MVAREAREVVIVVGGCNSGWFNVIRWCSYGQMIRGNVVMDM